MKGDVVAVVLLFLTAYSCQAENGIVNSKKQLFCLVPNGNRWQKFSDVSTFWETIHNDDRYSGAYSNILTITNFQIEDSGHYRCKIDNTNTTGANIVLNPEVQEYIGSVITLTCTVFGTPLYWYIFGISGERTLTDDANYEGSSTNYLKIKFLTTYTAGYYYCRPKDGKKGPDIKVSILTCASWTVWSACSETCGTGQRQRSCTCSGTCPGSGSQSESCIVNSGFNGGWSSWDSWGACNVTCGNGQQRRRHSCTNPSPANGGASCQGEEYDYNSCTKPACPVNGGWSSWTSWGACNVTCGTGQQSRRRYCNNPSQANAGADCQGAEIDLIACARSQCAGGDRQEGMYINIARASRQSSSDTDDVIPSRLSTKDTIKDEGNTYYNNADILTTIKIEDLKDYIKRKQVNEGLHSEYKSIPYGPQHPTTIAQKKENMPRNRFKTTFPYDHTRVILKPVPGSPHTDYINANLVDGFEKESCYIASQGPLKHTFTDFWAMIWQNNTRKIIMLTNLIEVNKVKCDKYWPEGGKPMVLGNLILTLQSEKERAAYVTRQMSVEDKKTKEKRNIIQYHFTAWPDHGTPDPLYLVLFHRHVISDHSEVESGKLLVHCSAGIGRTGTYIGLDALKEEGGVTGCVDIVKFVKKMRYSRMNMVQTPDQYVCLHYALLEAFTMKDTKIGKDEFGTIWREIQSDKQPMNHQKLYKEFKMLEAKKSEHGKSEHTAAVSPENIEKNRNKSVIPSDNNRLFLTTYDRGRTDYINAVQAPSYTKFVGYLTTQLPLPDTKIDFWTMIRDHNSSTVVMFINEQTEAEFVYAPLEDTFSCGSFTMKITKREKVEFDILSCTVVFSRKDEKSREIVIYCAVCSGYPKPNVLCKLVNMISTRVSMSHDAVTVVSGDGAKTCGLFCTFANAVSSMTIDDNADIFQLARLLQLRRPEFFSDFDEYRLCYEALNFYLESTNVYANF
ncbi:receptor-type tyrosine-protein phosphatase gamma-like [Mytilus trossulus]|uniref:receptor-type tyrosine-protein phosphatase gamma-like n=1 Tax=Mytilus trossulus TaxID=6551 RepID=UPI003005B9B0